MLLALLIVVLNGCTPLAGPQEIATQFWQALIAGESDRLSHLVREVDRARLAGGRTIVPVRSFELGRMALKNERAEIETRISIAGETPMHLQIMTVLVRVDERWRVDYATSVRAISRDSELAKVFEQLNQLGVRLGAGLDRSLDELQLVIPKLDSELSKIGKELRKRLEELSKGLREPRPNSSARLDEREAI